MAVRLPRELVDALNLKSGDELEVVATADRRFEMVKRDRAEEFLRALNAFRFELPADYRFNREEANRR